MICAIVIVAVLLAFLIKWGIGEKSEKLEIWAHVATIAGTIIGAASIAWAAKTFYDGSQLQRELSAVNLYREHLELSLDHPSLADRTLPKDSGDTREVDLEKYQWYVGHALFSFEAIFDAEPNDLEWEAVAHEFITTHGDYIRSEEFPCEQYTAEIRERVNSALETKRCSLDPRPPR